MGFISDFFRKKDNANQAREDDSYKKSMIANQIVNLVDQIKRINSFDSSIWNMTNISITELERKSVGELERLRNSLDYRLSELNKQSQTRNSKREELEASKWTGRKPQGLTNHEFDRFQRDDR